MSVLAEAEFAKQDSEETISSDLMGALDHIAAAILVCVHRSNEVLASPDTCA